MQYSLMSFMVKTKSNKCIFKVFITHLIPYFNDVVVPFTWDAQKHIQPSFSVCYADLVCFSAEYFLLLLC